MSTRLPNPNTLLRGLNTLDRALADFEPGRANQLYERASSDTNVKAVVNGLGRVASIFIADTELTRTPTALATKVKDVVNQAIAAAYAATSTAIAAFAQGLSLPGLPA